MLFILKLKMKICFGRSNDKVTSDETESSSSSTEDNDDRVFVFVFVYVDHIQPGEQLKVDDMLGLLGHKRKVKTTVLKKDNVTKSCLYRKYVLQHVFHGQEP